MEYDAEKKAFLCLLCGPGQNKWKNAFNAVHIDKKTGDVYCLVHREVKIGRKDMCPDWRDYE